MTSFAISSDAYSLYIPITSAQGNPQLEVKATCTNYHPDYLDLQNALVVTAPDEPKPKYLKSVLVKFMIPIRNDKIFYTLWYIRTEIQDTLCTYQLG